MLDKTDIEKIEKLSCDFTFVHQSFTAHGSRTYKDFLKVMDATKEGSVPALYKELIAVGISSFHNCEPCMLWHIGEALKHGATDTQVIEALDVAIEMGGGPVVVRSSFAFKILEYYKMKGKPQKSAG